MSNRAIKSKKWKEFITKLKNDNNSHTELRKLFTTYVFVDDGRINSNTKKSLPEEVKNIIVKGRDKLLITYAEEELITSRKEIPPFWYIIGNKYHRYYPDIYIPKDNLIIEVKSDYTYSCNTEINKAKFNSVIQNGFKLNVMVYTSKGILAEVIHEY